MKKLTLITSLLIYSILTFGQTFTFPLNTSPTFYSRSVTIGGATMVPVAIATKNNYNMTTEKVALSYFDKAWGFNHATKITIYPTVSDFEANTNGVDITGVSGVEALAFDNSTFGNLFVMETENGGGNLKIYDFNNNLLANYSSGDIGTDLGGAGFHNSRGMAFDNSNNVYISDDVNNRIIKISNPTNKALHTTTVPISLPTGSSPKSVCIKGDSIYIACFGTNNIKIYNITSNAWKSDVSTGTFSPLDLDIKKYNGNYLYSSQLDQSPTNNKGQVVAYDLSNNSVVQTYTDFGYSNGPWGLNVNGKGDLYCTDGSNDRFVKYARTRLSAKDILTFTVDNQIGNSTINATIHTVNITVPMSQDLSSINTHYTLSDFATATPNSYDYNLIPTNFSVTNPVPYTVTAENGTSQIWNVTIVKATPPVLSSSKEILTFSIPSQVGTSTINSTNSTIDVTMPAGTNVSALIPSFTLSASASSNPPTGTAVNFTNPATIVVTAQDSSTKSWVVKVTNQSASVLSTDKFSFNLYPNPSSNMIQFEISNLKSIPLDYQITNLEGRTIMQGIATNLKNEISIKDLSKGIYFLKVHSDELNNSFKFTKE